MHCCVLIGIRQTYQFIDDGTDHDGPKPAGKGVGN